VSNVKLIYLGSSAFGSLPIEIPRGDGQ